jgi:hypothetical protein
MDSANQVVLGELEKKDELVLAASDSTDLRASIVLLLATFLATETAKLFDKSHTGILVLLEGMAGLAIASSLVAAVVSLFPREYRYPDPVALQNRLETARNQFAGDARVSQNPALLEALMTKQAEAYRFEGLQQRILHNQKHNLAKNSWLNTSFYFAVLALLLYVVVSAQIYLKQ